MAPHPSFRSTPRLTLASALLVLSALAACAPSGIAPFRPPTLESPRCAPCGCEPDASLPGDITLPDAPGLDHDGAMSSPTEPFTLEPASDRIEVHAGEEAWIGATLTRAAGHASLVALAASGLPPHVTARAAIGPDPGVIAFLIETSDLARPVTEWPFTIEARADGTSSTRRILLTVRPERETPEE